jgi:hypothetical protein
MLIPDKFEEYPKRVFFAIKLIKVLRTLRCAGDAFLLPLLFCSFWTPDLRDKLCRKSSVLLAVPHIYTNQQNTKLQCPFLYEIYAKKTFRDSK